MILWVSRVFRIMTSPNVGVLSKITLWYLPVFNFWILAVKSLADFICLANASCFYAKTFYF